MSEQNKKTIRIVREEAPTNLSLLDGLYTSDYVYQGIPLLGDLKGPDAFKALFTGFVSAIADFREEVMDQIAEGDKVVTRLSGSGRHTGEVMGAAPTGKELKWRAVIISRFHKGKITEEWAEFMERNLVCAALQTERNLVCAAIRCHRSSRRGSEDPHPRFSDRS